MSIGKYHDDIYPLIKQNGAMGVNQLSKALNIPLSTMQKYLDKDQTYFKKNHARKWDLPEESAKEDMSIVSSNYSNVIDSQLTSMNALIDTLMSQFRATITLIEANKTPRQPVAGNSPNIDPHLITLDKHIKQLYAVFKKYMSKCPEKYQYLIKNVDLYQLTIEKGLHSLDGTFSQEITALFLEKNDTLSDEVLDLLETYQKEA